MAAVPINYQETDSGTDVLAPAPGTPEMTQIRPKLQITPKSSFEGPPQDAAAVNDTAGRRHHHAYPAPTHRDSVLISQMSNHRLPDVAYLAGTTVLPQPHDEEDDYPEYSPAGGKHSPTGSSSRRDSEASRGGARMRSESLPGLADLAAGALRQVRSRESRTVPRLPPDLTVNRLTIHDGPHTAPPRSSLRQHHPSSESFHNSYHQQRKGSSLLTPPENSNSNSESLPPIQAESPLSEYGSQQLPSISSQLGDVHRLPLQNERAGSFSSSRSFATSPPGSYPPMSMRHTSPPTSPRDIYSKSVGSPHSYMTAPSPYYSSSAASDAHRRHQQHHHHHADYSSSAGETPSTDHSVSTPATSAASVTDAMSIDAVSGGSCGPPPGLGFRCNEQDCNAAPFQTQYLLNSHLNVHSQSRPHYCPVKGCPRAEGGTGFKRKNEMIRHGLVHESPGYSCPFCPDREHRYPRPDNLQRHVRAHHADKDKDDPRLRSVLAQRAEGPSRGRRRRT